MQCEGTRDEELRLVIAQTGISGHDFRNFPPKPESTKESVYLHIQMRLIFLLTNLLDCLLIVYAHFTLTAHTLPGNPLNQKMITAKVNLQIHRNHFHKLQ